MVLVHKEARRRYWADGRFRASAVRSRRGWQWHVWEAIGPVTVAQGMAHTVLLAEGMVWDALWVRIELAAEDGKGWARFWYEVASFVAIWCRHAAVPCFCGYHITVIDDARR